MRTLGLIGGMSWESTVPYYRIINETVREHLGGLHSAQLLLYSVDFHDIEHLQAAGDWKAAGQVLARAAVALQTAGADALVLCTNTMHRVAPAIETAVQIPLLHIVDATALRIRQHSVKTVGLLGTRFTMEQDFYTRRLRERHGISCVTPDAADRGSVHRMIYDELCVGRVRDESRVTVTSIIRRLVTQGAEGIILGCTELSLLIGADDAPVLLFDTAALHARHAAEWALDR